MPDTNGRHSRAPLPLTLAQELVHGPHSTPTPAVARALVLDRTPRKCVREEIQSTDHTGLRRRVKRRKKSPSQLTLTFPQFYPCCANNFSIDDTLTIQQQSACRAPQTQREKRPALESRLRPQLMPPKLVSQNTPLRVIHPGPLQTSQFATADPEMEEKRRRRCWKTASAHSYKNVLKGIE